MIQEQAQAQSAKLWKLLSSYQWEVPQDREVKEYEEGWDQEKYDNAMRGWVSFANHSVGGDSSISLESWHDDIHDFAGTGADVSGHMADRSIAGVSFPSCARAS